MLHETVPAGVLLGVPLVSVTVAVQLVALPCTTELGVQLTLVLVARFTVSAGLVLPLLVAKVISPP